MERCVEGAKVIFNIEMLRMVIKDIIGGEYMILIYLKNTYNTLGQSQWLKVGKTSLQVRQPALSTNARTEAILRR